MAERDKTHVYLERVKTLEERARVLLQLSTLIVSVAAAVAALVEASVLRALLLIIASFFTSLSALQAISYLSEAERIWVRLLRDPSSNRLLLAAFMVLSGGLLALAILALLGLWR